MLESIANCLCTPTVLLSSVLALAVLYFLNSRTKNLPPGPTGLPLVGYAPFLSSKPHLKLKALAETYGDVMCMNFAGQTVIVLNSFEATKEALVVKGNEFAGRPQDNSFLQWIVDGLGITQAEGPVWKEHRRFALHTLRDFGFGKLSLEQRVQEIADDLIQTLVETKGKPHIIETDLSISATNVICSMMFDKHYEKNDPEFVAIRHMISTILKRLQGSAAFLDTPLAKFIPRSLIPGYKKMEEIKSNMHRIIANIIKDHQEAFDPNNLKDYVDVYLNERLVAEKEGRLQDSTFTLERLLAISLNLFIAGSETTSTTLNWGIKILMVNQDVQKAIQAELDHVIGRERRPSILDRANLPYTEAAIMEIHRYASMLVLYPPRSNPEQAELLGFTIPKRSLIMVNGWAINHDQRHFVDPETFRPTRFLGADGKVEKPDFLIPFSIGKRSCPGESLARMELFLFLTALLQHFSFEFPDGVEPNLDHDITVARRLKLYELCAKPRY